MSHKGHKFTDEQRSRLSKAHLGQHAWNKGTGGCKKGHDPKLYKCLPSGVYVCLGFKRENGKKYREKNQKTINPRNRVERYKESIDELYSLYQMQGGVCAICGDDIELVKCRIDHDHKTGMVRGLLCTSCNTGLGLLKDSAEILIMAAEYLRKPNG